MLRWQKQGPHLITYLLFTPSVQHCDCPAILDSYYFKPTFFFFDETNTGCKTEEEKSLCQVLLYAKHLNVNTGPKYLSEKLKALVGYGVLVATPQL